MDHVSRREAADLLGFQSEFKIRELEKAGRLRAVRGAMAQAWYPRAQVMSLRQALDAALSPRRAGTGPAGETPPARAHPGGRGRATDGDLIAYLRAVPGRTVVDVVADLGVSIGRAGTVYRFWLAHDVHPAAQALRAAGAGTVAATSAGGRRQTGGGSGAILAAVAAARAAGVSPGERATPAPAERRGDARRERDQLIRQLRAADPATRATAFDRLKRPRPP